jgi:hypothetical protein
VSKHEPQKGPSRDELDRRIRPRPCARALKPDALVLLHVVPAALPPEFAAEQQKAAETLLGRRLRRKGSQPASDRSHAVLTGSASSTIITESISDAAELIIIGKPGTRPLFGAVHRRYR